MNDKYSVLMSVYHKEKPLYLKTSVESVMNQTTPPDDFVLVCDGPLNEPLYKVIDELKTQFPIINTVQLKENVGLGSALSEGLKHVKNEIVMRMDSDDVCLPDRAKCQLPLMADYDLVGGWISEFEDKENNIIGVRSVPEKYKQIKKFSKRRSPFNHPSVMFRKELIEKVGGYLHLLYVEDYYLWIRILQITDKVYNLQKVLVNMRSGKEMRARRGGKAYKQSIKKLRKYMVSKHIISPLRYAFLCFEQDVFYILPLGLKEQLYKSMLRKRMKWQYETSYD